MICLIHADQKYLELRDAQLGGRIEILRALRMLQQTLYSTS